MRNPFRREPAPPGFGAGKVVPEVTAHVGFSRPLEKADLWSLPDERSTEFVTDELERQYFLRCEPVKRPKHLWDELARIEAANPKAQVAAAPVGTEKAEKGSDDDEAGSAAADVNPPPSPYDGSLAKALFKLVYSQLCMSGVLTLIADTLRTTTPLVSKVLLNWLVASYVYVRVGETERAALGLATPRGIAYGIGVGIGIFAMQAVTQMTNHALKKSMTAGQTVRSAIVGAAFRKALRLSGRARQEHSVGKIITMISTDATNLELFMSYIHQIWVAPIQLILGIGLLIGTLGYSALVGLGVIVFGFPIQGILVKIMFEQRNKSIKITDKRVQLTNEVLQGIRLIKCYGWETFYLHRIGGLREEEVKAIRKSMIALCLLICIFHSVPITYSLTGHDLNIPTIFAALQLFNLIRLPLLMLPVALSSLSSTLIALNRMSNYLSSEELEEPYTLDPASEHAVWVDADFTWEAIRKPSDDEKDKDTTKPTEQEKKKQKKSKNKKAAKGGSPKDESAEEKLPSTSADVMAAEKESPPEPEDPPFELKNLHLSIQKGALIGIVGRIGSGKSSLLQALIGEMRKTRGHVVVSGSVAYVPQTPWIQNATLRDNILFGQPLDEARLREVTEIGEKGINLSGGQKARVSLARAAYSRSDIILLDDPLSAVDAYVGKTILEHCLINGPLAAKTRILVTHSLHVLDKMDYVYVVENGQIVEQGTYKELMADGEAFSRLIDEYGRLDKGESPSSPKFGPRRQATTAKDDPDTQLKEVKDVLMQLEERSTGAVRWEIYKRYFFFAGGVIWIPIIISLLATMQATSGHFWTSMDVPGFKQGFAEALLTLVLSFTFFAGGLVGSLRMYKAALKGILRSPLSFFDTTPMGRILSRLSKDQEVLDNELAGVLYSFLSIFFSIFGVIALVFYTFPYLGIIFPFMATIYYLVGIYYRATSVETKRLDSVLRSSLYASVSESLTGLSTIRAYRIQERKTTEASEGLDVQNRAHYMTITVQRWLAVRLDFFGNLLVFGITLFAAGFRHNVNPAKIGVVLSYTLSSEMVAQFAHNEQNMNAVERVLHYTDLQPEGALETPEDPDESWPQNGEIKFTDIQLAYRPGLPLVLKNVSFAIRPREKIGIVGRTGAGKSSLLQGLIQDLEIDGVDISKIGLDTLRTRLALVPQDNTLFTGTLRDNLDPHGTKTDAEIIYALQRASLLPPTGASDPQAEEKFRLDASVNDEGSNFSAGEKQLLALCRALVRSNRIIILATSNVDVETDAKVQRTIQTEFASSTLLCIAHRLNTVAYYDRILVMDRGEVAEFDTVLNLFDNEGSIFRSLCNESQLTRSDICRIRGE
ncbi:cadmium ion transporter [Ephemerocybe angulata]|uniref:Cadmium ion transporter n=1 Tax=Ephemerocybe angulata TaxID=980116 RepID=A0A8H6I8Q6_9AGAR|nr:cadmium ion transporter [Tulosesus angulatus]